MKNLIFLREQNNITQKQLAEYLGMTRQGYAHYEQGDREPDPTTLIKLADFFSVSVDYLLERETTDLKLSSPRPEYQRIFESLSPEAKENMLELMRIYSKASIRTQIKVLGRVEGWIFDEEAQKINLENVKR